MKKNNDNSKLFRTLLIHPVMIGVYFVLLALLISKAQESETLRQSRKQKTEQINNLDAQIQQKFQSVDSLHNTVDARTMDSLMRHLDYRAVVQNRPRIDSLRRANDCLINLAYTAARKRSQISVARRNESVFKDFFDVPAVKNANWQYYLNKKEIQKLTKREQAVDNLPHDVRAHFDSVANAQARQHLMQIDSLLKQKDSLISDKSR